MRTAADDESEWHVTAMMITSVYCTTSWKRWETDFTRPPPKYWST